MGGDDDPNSPGYCLAYHGRPIADCAGNLHTLIGQSVTCWAQTVETAGKHRSQWSCRPCGGHWPTGGVFQGIALRAHLFLGAFQSPSSCARLANSRTPRSKSSLHVECQLPHLFYSMNGINSPVNTKGPRPVQNGGDPSFKTSLDHARSQDRVDTTQQQY